MIIRSLQLVSCDDWKGISFKKKGRKEKKINKESYQWSERKLTFGNIWWLPVEKNGERKYMGWDIFLFFVVLMNICLHFTLSNNTYVDIVQDLDGSQYIKFEVECGLGHCWPRCSKHQIHLKRKREIFKKKNNIFSIWLRMQRRQKLFTLYNHYIGAYLQ